MENEGLVEAIWTFDDTYLTLNGPMIGEVESDGLIPYVIEGILIYALGHVLSEIINLTNTDMTLRINTAFGSFDFVFENAKDLTKMNLRFTLFASALLLLNACSKFENGPNVSFRSPEERIMGEWLATSNLIEDFEIQELRFEFLEEQFTITQVDLDGDVARR